MLKTRLGIRLKRNQPQL
uniref:Uncharacterized protein n=1 Tax=Arundo donax TaxID=35708 RepID=A0A0A8ZV30_ARUDO